MGEDGFEPPISFDGRFTVCCPKPTRRLTHKKESRGFEPLCRFRPTVFKTAAISHSANFPNSAFTSNHLYGAENRLRSSL